MDCGIAAMHQVLDDLKSGAGQMGANWKFPNEGERFCLTFAPQCAEYVHAHMAENEFLTRFIVAIQDMTARSRISGMSLDFSEEVTFGKDRGQDFDYLIYFTDGKPNDYRYCITFEGCHVIYHRFTREDFGDLYPEFAAK